MYTYSNMLLRVLNTAESVVCILGEALDFGGPVAAALPTLLQDRAWGKRGQAQRRLLYASMSV